MFLKHYIAVALLGMTIGANAFADAEFDQKMAEARSVPKITQNDKGGLYLGVEGQAGQVYSSAPKSDPGLAVLYGVEPGFIMQNDSWGRLELGVAVKGGKISFREDGARTDIDLTFAVMPRLGWGYSLGSGLFGVLEVTAGPGNIDLKSSKDGASSKSKNNGAFLFGGGYKIVFGGEVVEGFAGVDIYHTAFNVDKADGVKVDKKYDLNLILASIGARIRF